MAETLPHPGEDRRSSLRRWMKVAIIGGAIVALVVVVWQRDSGDSGGGPGGHQRPDDSGGQTFTEEQQAEFAQCMRDQGLDVQLGEGGEMSPPPGVDVNGSQFQEALATCQEQFAPAGGQPPAGGGHP